jgi:hypothetical protein
MRKKVEEAKEAKEAKGGIGSTRLGIYALQAAGW